MSVIKANDLLLYIDDKPIEVSTDYEFKPSVDYLPCTTPIEGEFTFETFPEIGDNEYTRRLIWYNVKNLPRKKKKRFMTAFRKGYTINITFK